MGQVWPGGRCVCIAYMTKPTHSLPWGFLRFISYPARCPISPAHVNAKFIATSSSSVITALSKTMPPFQHPSQIPAALRNQAMPALEYLAANDDARNRALNRFERDEPPPYISSTESEEFDDRLWAPPPDTLPEDLQTTIEQPLNQEEQRRIAHNLGWEMSASSRYREEARLENFRLLGYKHKLLFRGDHGKPRANIIIRHNIKRRWSKLGIWNPEWGIPGRLNERPEDKIAEWRWRWDRDITDRHEHGKQLVKRALGLRQNLRRGETCPVQPRSHLQPDATASQAESFLISRPWFTWYLETSEESKRNTRLPSKYWRSTAKHIVKRWKERGDWRERDLGHLRPSPVYSWKWRHESPSPEPEDLTPLTNIEDSPLEAVDMDFTPSEIDAFEEIPPPVDPWAWKRNYVRRSPLRGPVGSLFGPTDPSRPNLFHPLELPDRSASGDLPAPLELPEQKDETIVEQFDNPRPSAPKQGNWRQRQGQGRHKANPSPDQTLRRSARIAALTSSTRLSSSQTAAGEKVVGGARQKVIMPTTIPSRRGARGRPKTRAIPARPPPKEKDARPKRGRGRPRKMNGISKPSLPTKIPARRLAPGRVKRDNLTATGTYTAPSVAQAAYKQSRQKRKWPETRTVLGNIRVSKSEPGRSHRWRRKPTTPQTELTTIEDLKPTSQGNSNVAAIVTRRGRALRRGKEEEAPPLPQLRLQKVSNSRRSTRAKVKSPSTTQSYRTHSGRVSKPPARWIPRWKRRSRPIQCAVSA